MKIKVTIVDDHPMIIDGLKNMLKGYDHITLISSFNDGTSLLNGLPKMQPDVLLMDIQLPDKQGDELAAWISKNYPQIRMLALTNFNSLIYITTMLQRGVSGYLLKTTTQETLIEAIETVYKGEQFIEPSLKAKLSTQSEKPVRKYFKVSLTIREKEVLKLLVTGYSNQKIAEQLFLGYNTVRNYRARIFEKLEVSTIGELINKAIQLGLAEE